jgi:hypothetical protein
MLPSPITNENIPWALVIASLDSWYSVVLQKMMKLTPF